MEEVESAKDETQSASSEAETEVEKTSASEKSTKYPPCIICNKDIIQCDELITLLMITQKTFSNTESNKKRVFTLFTCRVCDYADLHQEKIAEHIILHFQSNEILYCQQCQEKANPTKLFFFEEHEDGIVPYETLLQRRKRMVHFTLEHIEPLVVNCRSCMKSFGYLIPVLNRTIHSFEGQGYECNVCSDMEHHIGSILKHVQGHIQSREFICLNCKQYKPKEEVRDEAIEQISNEEISKTDEPTENEYQKFKDKLLAVVPPPFSIPLSTSSSAVVEGEKGEKNAPKLQVSLSSSESLQQPEKTEKPKQKVKGKKKPKKNGPEEKAADGGGGCCVVT